MKNLIIFIFALTLTSCSVNARQSADAQKLTLTGNPLPTIRHVNDMKIAGDTLWFVYETEDGFGQCFLRRAAIDTISNNLTVSSDIGKRSDGYYLSYMPYSFIAADGTVRVIGQDDSEIYSVENDTALVGPKQYLLGSTGILPFPIAQYTKDVFMTSPHQYVFIGREPNGGPHYAMSANMITAEIDTIRKINISPDLQSWMANMGELAYSATSHRLAFAYLLHPIIEIFGTDSHAIKSVRLGEDTFDSKTLEEADFENLNVLHTVDITYTPDYIYALYWGYRYNDSVNSTPAIIKIDWNGNIIYRQQVSIPLHRIAASDNAIIGWTGENFVMLKLP